MNATAEVESVRESLRYARYFLPYLRPDLRLALGMIGLSFVAIILRFPIIYLPAILTAYFQVPGSGGSSGGLGWPVAGIVDILKNHFGSPGYLFAAVTIAFTAIIILSPLQLLRSYWSCLLGSNLLLRLRMALFGNLRHLSMLAIYARGAGSFVQRLTRDLMLTNGLFASTLPGLARLFMEVALYLTALLLLETELTIIVLVAYAALQPALLLFNRRIQRQSNRLQELHEQLTTQMLESVGGYRDIAATGQFERMSGRFRERAIRLRREGIRSLLWSQSGELLLDWSFTLLTVVPYFLILHRLDRVEQVGHLITYIGFLSSLLPALAGLWGSTIDLAIATPSLRSLRDMLEQAAKPTETESAQELAIAKAVGKVADSEPAQPPLGQEVGPSLQREEKIRSIRFDGVGLNLGGRWILRDLTFQLAGEQMTAIIGQSGSGKTTIFHLLLRLLTPTCGAIHINDTLLAAFPEDSLRRLIGFIPQNPFIFNASLRENILVSSFRPDPADQILEDAVKVAQLEELVRSRAAEGGLEASAGYLGMRLSAGERQRIALARLLIQDPPIIVCDEYTANIDVVTAKLIQDMMRTRLAGRTRVVITHELYNARNVDQILVLDGGRIVQSGKHSELVSLPGLYRTMWEAQRLQ